MLYCLEEPIMPCKKNSILFYIFVCSWKLCLCNLRGEAAYCTGFPLGLWWRRMLEHPVTPFPVARVPCGVSGSSVEESSYSGVMLFPLQRLLENLIDRSSGGVDQLSLIETSLTAAQLNTHLRTQCIWLETQLQMLLLLHKIHNYISINHNVFQCQYLTSKSEIRHRPHISMFYCPDPGIVY